MSGVQLSTAAPIAPPAPAVIMGPTAPLRHPNVGRYDLLETALITTHAQEQEEESTTSASSPNTSNKGHHQSSSAPPLLKDIVVEFLLSGCGSFGDDGGKVGAEQPSSNNSGRNDYAALLGPILLAAAREEREKEERLAEALRRKQAEEAANTVELVEDAGVAQPAVATTSPPLCSSSASSSLSDEEEQRLLCRRYRHLLSPASVLSNAIRSLVEVCGLSFLAKHRYDDYGRGRRGGAAAAAGGGGAGDQQQQQQHWFGAPWCKALLYGSSALGGSVDFSDIDVLLLLGATVHPQYSPHSPAFYDAYNEWSPSTFFAEFPTVVERAFDHVLLAAVKQYAERTATAMGYAHPSAHPILHQSLPKVHVTPITSARVPVLKFNFCDVHVDIVMAGYCPPLKWFDANDNESDATFPFSRRPDLVGHTLFPSPMYEGGGQLFMQHVEAQQALFLKLHGQYYTGSRKGAKKQQRQQQHNGGALISHVGSVPLSPADIQRVLLLEFVAMMQSDPSTSPAAPSSSSPPSTILTSLAKVLLLTDVEELLLKGQCEEARRVRSQHTLLCSAAWLIYRRVPLASMRGAINGVRTILMLQRLLPSTQQALAYSPAIAATPPSSGASVTPSAVAAPSPTPSPPPFTFYHDVYTVALKFIKVWARRRGIYGNLYGFAPGVSWAILTVRGCQLTPSRYVSVVLRQFFKNMPKLLGGLGNGAAAAAANASGSSDAPPLYITRSLFMDEGSNGPSSAAGSSSQPTPRIGGLLDPWRPSAGNGVTSPTTVATPGGSGGGDAMPVISPAYPFGNSSHTASGNGKRLVLEELKLAGAILSAKPLAVAGDDSFSSSSSADRFPVNSLADLEAVLPPFVFIGDHPSYDLIAAVARAHTSGHRRRGVGIAGRSKRKVPSSSLPAGPSIAAPLPPLPHPNRLATMLNVRQFMRSHCTDPLMLNASSPTTASSPTASSSSDASYFDAFLCVDACVSLRALRRCDRFPAAFYDKLFGIWAGFVESRVRFLVYSLEGLVARDRNRELLASPPPGVDGSAAPPPPPMVSLVGVEAVRPYPDRIDRKVLIDGNNEVFVENLRNVNNCATMAMGLRFKMAEDNGDGNATASETGEGASPQQRKQKRAARLAALSEGITQLLQPAVNDFIFAVESACTVGKPYAQRKNTFVTGVPDANSDGSNASSANLFVRDPLMLGPYCRLVMVEREEGEDGSVDTSLPVSHESVVSAMLSSASGGPSSSAGSVPSVAPSSAFLPVVVNNSAPIADYQAPTITNDAIMIALRDAADTLASSDDDEHRGGAGVTSITAAGQNSSLNLQDSPQQPDTVHVLGAKRSRSPSSSAPCDAAGAGAAEQAAADAVVEEDAAAGQQQFFDGAPSRVPLSPAERAAMATLRRLAIENGAAPSPLRYHCHDGNTAACNGGALLSPTQQGQGGFPPAAFSVATASTIGVLGSYSKRQEAFRRHSSLAPLGPSSCGGLASAAAAHDQHYARQGAVLGGGVGLGDYPLHQQSGANGGSGGLLPLPDLAASIIHSSILGSGDSQRPPPPPSRPPPIVDGVALLDDSMYPRRPPNPSHPSLAGFGRSVVPLFPVAIHRQDDALFGGGGKKRKAAAVEPPQHRGEGPIASHQFVPTPVAAAATGGDPLLSAPSSVNSSNVIDYFDFIKHLPEELYLPLE